MLEKSNTKLPAPEQNLSSELYTMQAHGEKIALLLPQPGHKYVAKDLDYVWGADFTKVKNAWVFIVIDYCTRKVNGWSCIISKKPGNSFTSKEVVHTLSEAVHNYQRPKVLQTDSGAQFLTAQFTEFLESQDIIHCRGNASLQPHHNQVVERFNRTLKKALKKKAQLHFNFEKEPKDFKWMSRLNPPKTLEWIGETIEEFNNTPHTHLRGNSPVQVETALALSPISNHDLPHLASNQSTEGQLIQTLKKIAVEKNSQGWIEFFIAWRAKAARDHRETLEKLQQGFQSQEERSKQILQKQELEADRVINAQKAQLEQVQNHVQQLNEQLNELQRKEFERELQEKEAAEKRARFDARKRRPLRDAATSPELSHAISVAQQRNYQNEFVRSRDIVALIILFATGVRIGNILQCTVNNLNAFLEKGVFSVPAIKTRRNKEVRIPITERVSDLALQHKVHFERVCQGKEGNQKVITSKGSEKSINRSVFDVRINSILKETSKKFKKNITSHSFRIGQVTSMINCGGIHQAQQLIGHSDIRTTSLYSRNLLSHTAALRLYEKLDLEKGQKIPRQWKRNFDVKEKTGGNF